MFASNSPSSSATSSISVPAQSIEPAVASAKTLAIQPACEDPWKGRMALSIHEAAQALGVSDKTIRRLIDRKLLRASRAIRHFLIPKAELERFLRDSTGSSWKA